MNIRWTLGIEIELHGRLQGVLQQVGKEDADDESDIDGGNRLDSLPGRQRDRR